jgi:hypothetical protein
MDGNVMTGDADAVGGLRILKSGITNRPHYTSPRRSRVQRCAE